MVGRGALQIARYCSTNRASANTHTAARSNATMSTFLAARVSPSPNCRKQNAITNAPRVAITVSGARCSHGICRVFISNAVEPNAASVASPNATPDFFSAIPSSVATTRLQQPARVGIQQEEKNHRQRHHVHVEQQQYSTVVQTPPRAQASRRVPCAKERRQSG